MHDERVAQQRKDTIAWSCGLGIVTVVIAAALVGVRDALGNTNIALILVAVIVAGAALGGRAAGVTAALCAAASFNFFHTQPYLSLRIKEADDIVTVILLVVVGLIVGELALLRRRTHDEVVTRAAGAQRLEAAVALAVAGAPVEDVWRSVHDGVIAELGVRTAEFRPGAGSADLPLVARSGRVVPSLTSWAGREFQLPEHAAIPVVAPGGVVGHIAIEGTPGRGVSIDERRIAVGLADVLALVIDRSGLASLSLPEGTSRG